MHVWVETTGINVEVITSSSLCNLICFWLAGCCGYWEGLVRKRDNHTSLVAVATPTDRHKSVRNRCVIKLFVGVFVLSRCFVDIVDCCALKFCHMTEPDFFLFLLNDKTVIWAIALLQPTLKKTSTLQKPSKCVKFRTLSGDGLFLYIFWINNLLPLSV